MDDTRLGFLGVGSMGLPMVRRLLGAGRAVTVFDPQPGRLAAAVELGAEPVAGEMAVAFGAGTILCSLRSSEQFVQIARTKLLPAVRQDQVVINLGTARAKDTRKLAGLFRDRGVDLLDVPVSGGPGGAAAGTLRMFYGGPRERFDATQRLLAPLGERIVNCGPAGCGQIVKGVNQLAMGLRAAALVEAVTYGQSAGIDLAVIEQAVAGGDEAWRQELGRLIAMIRDGRGDQADTKHAELAYFLDDAAELGLPLPLAGALAGFLREAPRAYQDNMRRPVASFYHELRRAAGAEPGRKE